MLPKPMLPLLLQFLAAVGAVGATCADLEPNVNYGGYDLNMPGAYAATIGDCCAMCEAASETMSETRANVGSDEPVHRRGPHLLLIVSHLSRRPLGSERGARSDRGSWVGDPSMVIDGGWRGVEAHTERRREERTREQEREVQRAGEGEVT